MSEQNGPSDPANRRIHDRQVVCIPAYAHTVDTPESTALIRDISLSGAYFLTRTPFEPGDRIEFVLHWSGDPAGPTHTVTADVIRIEERDSEQAGIWPFGVAIRFDVELGDASERIEQLAELLAEKCPD